MITLIPKSKDINCSIKLPSSKSETNRAIIVKALSKDKIIIHNESDCSDSAVLKNSIEKISDYQHALESCCSNYLNLDVGACGTAMRFLTAYLSLQKGQYVLQGDERMHQRPIAPLVDSLLLLGADIKYLGKRGFPPLLITGVEQLIQTRPVKIDTSFSSQYLTALLLIAPGIKNGINIELPKYITSKPYIDMTLDIIKKAGINYSYINNCISIKEQSYKNANIEINGDWSCASYWYSIAALSDNANIKIDNISNDSLQADKAIVDIMSMLGVRTTYSNNSITITRTSDKLLACNNTRINFKNCPDIAQTVIPCFAIQNYKAKFEGLHTLKIKETDRILALQKELAKINYIFTNTMYENYVYYSYKKILYLDNLHKNNIQINTYKDHRMAMGFAPLAMKLGKLTIVKPEVVDKSYPRFWKDLKKIFIMYHNKSKI